MSGVPTENDWRGGTVQRWLDWIKFGSTRDDLGLDGESAFDQFFGKSHSEAVELFCDDGLSRIHDLYWMPCVCFKFYVNACMDYLCSENIKSDVVEANAFVSLIESRCHEFKQQDAELKKRIIETISSIGARQQKIGFSAEEFLSFSGYSDAIIKKLAAGTSVTKVQ